MLKYGGNPATKQTYGFNQQSLDYFNRLYDKMDACANDGYPCEKCPLQQACDHFWRNRVSVQEKISPYQFSGFCTRIAKFQSDKWWTVLVLLFPVRRRKRKKGRAMSLTLGVAKG